MFDPNDTPARIRNEFKTYLLQKDKERSTVKIYEAELSQFLQWASGIPLQLSDITPEHVLKYRESMLERGMKLATVNKAISVISTFFKWAKDSGYVRSNPAEHSRIPELKKPPRGLTGEEEAELLNCVSQERSGFKKARNEALLFVMLYAGLRLEEVSHLRLDSLQNGRLIVYDREEAIRSVPLDEQTEQKLNEWLRCRSLAKKAEHAGSMSLFVTERSGFMQPRAIQFVVESYSDKIGFPVVCQTLRHTYCYRMARQGASVRELKEWAGHRSILSTYQYYGQGGSFT